MGPDGCMARWRPTVAVRDGVELGRGDLDPFEDLEHRRLNTPSTEHRVPSAECRVLGDQLECQAGKPGSRGGHSTGWECASIGKWAKERETGGRLCLEAILGQDADRSIATDTAVRLERIA